MNVDCRLSGRKMLMLLRGKRLVFVGDSLNRNMWESLVCILRNSVEDKSRVFEASGRQEFRAEGSYSFIFQVCHRTSEMNTLKGLGFLLIICVFCWSNSLDSFRALV